MVQTRYVRWFEDLRSGDVPLVGGKNASLGEMISALKGEGVPVPDGFAITAEAYYRFLEENNLKDRIQAFLQEYANGKKPLAGTGKAIRDLFLHTRFPGEMADDIKSSYRELSSRYQAEAADVAVRSSATAEDLPAASFAGQQETFLNVRGEENVLEATRKCYASLFTDRAISYRHDQGFDHLKVALSAGIQKMVRSDKAGSGVMFTIDTDTGFPRAVVINAAWGLGENIVQGTVNPDEYMVFKPLLEKKGARPVIEKNRGDKDKKLVYAVGGVRTTRNVETTRQERLSFVLSDDEILQLARWGVIIEKHYNKAMDMEWAKDGDLNELFIVQARPETVQSRKKAGTFKSYVLKEKGERLVEGLAIGGAIAAGKAQVLKSADEIDRFKDGSILVTGMTDPDWEPIMKRAAGIITDHGGRTSHAAIVSRELGVPAVVGTGNATVTLKDGQEITLSCAEGERGYVYRGTLKFEARDIDLDKLPKIKTTLLINVGEPGEAFRWWKLPVQGIGLARLEFVIGNIIKAHPMALVHFDRVKDPQARKTIEELTQGYEDKTEYFVDKLAYGIGMIAASQYPNPVVVRTSDFKTNEYANLVGGKTFEFEEENPMIGFRGASRYYNDSYREGFALECRALKCVREEMGLTNVIIMIPFCRTLEEADQVLAEMAKNGLKRGQNGLEVYVMAEIPSNILLASEFSDRFDGFSIGSNDLTQLVLGVDRDSTLLAPLFDERNPAVKTMIRELIEAAHKKNRKVGLCGQAPSDHPDFAEFLSGAGIDSISLNPDSVIGVIERLAIIEKKAQEAAPRW
ncbi:MAG: phosphoenolpyruvate synthase [Endomicrobiales bacterium]